jgi:hypothetical protein
MTSPRVSGSADWAEAQADPSRAMTRAIKGLVFMLFLRYVEAGWTQTGYGNFQFTNVYSIIEQYINEITGGK